ncbi:hypothetical protein CLF_100825 [Clonorchis sinensis]|uniref:Uncharacterized protein n=1 Tax=Clonorchis sinensis TaxID=79923 RepID=G7Y4C1_CLOSI|nr:hypothetical protein CLF_100825 [Clonorchis sinensis]
MSVLFQKDTAFFVLLEGRCERLCDAIESLDSLNFLVIGLSMGNGTLKRQITFALVIDSSGSEGGGGSLTEAVLQLVNSSKREECELYTVLHSPQPIMNTTTYRFVAQSCLVLDNRTISRLTAIRFDSPFHNGCWPLQPLYDKYAVLTADNDEDDAYYEWYYREKKVS